MAAHILYKLGEKALKQTKNGSPIISRTQAMQLRAQFHREDQPWPYEDIVPGPPQMPPGSAAYLNRKAAKTAAKQARLKEIQDAMAKMPTLVSQYRAARKMDWDEVEPVDLLTMTRTAIRQKYVKRRLIKQT